MYLSFSLFVQYSHKKAFLHFQIVLFLSDNFLFVDFAKAVSRKQNETVAWQERERAFLTELCREQGIEIEVLGIQRENLSLPEYKAAMREVEALEQRAEILDSQKERLEQHSKSF